jgi:hypothetical protein
MQPVSADQFAGMLRTFSDTAFGWKHNPRTARRRLNGKRSPCSWPALPAPG